MASSVSQTVSSLPPRERCIISLSQVRHSVSRLWELVTATLIELVWHGLPKSEAWNDGRHPTGRATVPPSAPVFPSP